jgi:hypothetical protein
MDLSSLLSPDHTVESVLTTDCRQFGVPDDFADQMNTFCGAAQTVNPNRFAISSTALAVEIGDLPDQQIQEALHLSNALSRTTDEVFGVRNTATVAGIYGPCVRHLNGKDETIYVVMFYAVIPVRPYEGDDEWDEALEEAGQALTARLGSVLGEAGSETLFTAEAFDIDNAMELLATTGVILPNADPAIDTATDQDVQNLVGSICTGCPDRENCPESDFSDAADTAAATASEEQGEVSIPLTAENARTSSGVHAATDEAQPVVLPPDFRDKIRQVLGAILKDMGVNASDVEVRELRVNRYA